MLYAELAGLPGAETLHKPKALMRLFAAGPPRVCPASPVAPAPAPRPAARFPAPAAAHPAKFGPARAPSAPPAPGGPFPRAPPPRPPRGPLCARRGLGAPPRRFCARTGCAARRPPRAPCARLARPPAACPSPSAVPAVPPAPPRRPALCPRPTGLPLRLCPRAARPGPKGESNLCERFPGDRRALSREFSRNCRPGVLPQKHKKRARIGTLCQQSSVYRQFFAPVCFIFTLLPLQ